MLYTPPALTPYRERVSKEELARIAAGLQAGRWTAEVHQYHPRTLARTLLERRPRLVFNLAYGYVAAKGVHQTQAEVTARLEALDAHLVGSSAAAQRGAQDKLACAEVLRPHGIRSPELIRLNRPGRMPDVAVVKPRFGACHRGVHLVHPRADREKLLRLRTDLLLQEYVEGPEYTVGVVELAGQPTSLPVLRIRFADARRPQVMVAGHAIWHIEVDSRDQYGLGALAVRCFRILRLRDYARFDFRVDRRGPVLLDANALPNLEPTSSYLPLAARAAGVGYEELVNLLAESAMRRARGGCRQRQREQQRRARVPQRDHRSSLSSRTRLDVSHRPPPRACTLP